MKAMIFAAGLGSRLKPLTENTPKALLEVRGMPLIEHQILKLKKSGFTTIVINLHHFPEKIIEFIKSKKYFGVEIIFSNESEELLETGGGLKKAARFFQDETEPILLHNVDVISDLDPFEIIRYHKKNHALATLFVQQRTSSRYLLFDRKMQLCGWKNERTAEEIIKVAGQAMQKLAFNGIHVISPKILDLISQSGKFSIIDTYLQLAADHKILGYMNDKAVYLDVGKPESLTEAEHLINRIVI